MEKGNPHFSFMDYKKEINKTIKMVSNLEILLGDFKPDNLIEKDGKILVIVLWNFILTLKQ